MCLKAFSTALQKTAQNFQNLRAQKYLAAQTQLHANLTGWLQCCAEDHPQVSGKGEAKGTEDFQRISFNRAKTL